MSGSQFWEMAGELAFMIGIVISVISPKWEGISLCCSTDMNHQSVDDTKMIVAEVSIIVLGEGPSIGRFVRVAVEELKRSGLNTLSGPNSTSVEAASIDEVLEAVKRAHLAVVETGAMRVVTTLKIDDRCDKPATMETKMKAVN
jgi:uncharacterized protein (TIGR00106 family)